MIKTMIINTSVTSSRWKPYLAKDLSMECDPTVNNGQKTFPIAYYPFRYLSKSIDCRLLSASILYQLNYFHAGLVLLQIVLGTTPPSSLKLPVSIGYRFIFFELKD
jgi:hypothetical protein